MVINYLLTGMILQVQALSKTSPQTLEVLTFSCKLFLFSLSDLGNMERQDQKKKCMSEDEEMSKDLWEQLTRFKEEPSKNIKEDSKT